MDEGVHIHTERVTNSPVHDVLVERILVAVVREDSEIALTERHLIFTSSVYRNISIRDVFNVSNNPAHDLGDFNVCLVIDGNNLARGSVLPLVVRYLLDVLG